MVQMFRPIGSFRHQQLSTLFLLVFLVIAPCDCSSGQKSAAPTFKDGRTVSVPTFADSKKWIRHDLWVESESDSDGDGRKDRMHVGVTRPQQTETEGLKLPVLYMTSPYFGGVAANGGKGLFWDVRHELGDLPAAPKAVPITRRGKRPVISDALVREWLPHGYVIVHSSSPGTGLSQGCPTIGDDNESLAARAVIDWLNGRARGFTSVDGQEEVHATWTTGKVGMTGVSHPGTFALAAATTGVEGLEVVVPVAANTSPYHYYRSNGLVRHPLGFVGEDIDSMYNFVHSGTARPDYCNAMIRDKEMLQNLDRRTGDYNDFWKKRDYLLDLANVKCAVLMAHGLNDWNVVPEHGDRIYQTLKRREANTQVFYHQGGHGGSPPHGMMNRWFTHYLHGVENGVEKGPRAWIVREKAEHNKPTPYDDFPNPNASTVSLFPNVGSPKRGQLAIRRLGEQGRESLIDNFSFSGDALAQAEFTEHRLMYVSPTLTRPVHISGTPRITVRLASSKPTANLSVWLVSLPWNERRNARITDNIITRGWADPQNYESINTSKPLEPGRFYELSFDLQPDDQIIPAGQQIGLMIFSSDREFTLHPEPGTQLTVDLDATSLALPIVGGKVKLEDALQTKNRQGKKKK